jgi:uncharacterized cupin superfamily protein
VRFPAGEDGGHQLANDTDQPVQLIAISTHGQSDIVLYPDEGRVGPAERRPDGSGFKAFFQLEDSVGYNEGLEAPEVRVEGE